jgi:hypothetical protein
LATAPLIILYGYGYRYDLRYYRFVKTGNLFVTSSPANASVLINGQSRKASWYESLLIYKRLPWVIKLSGQTPVNLTGLLPGKYDLTIQKNNYQPWQKQIEIIPEKTTVIENVKLFLKSPQTEWTKTINHVENFWLAPSKTKIIYLEKDKKMLNYLSITNSQFSPIETIKDKILKVDWSPNEKLILLKTNKEQKVIDLEKQILNQTKNFFNKFSSIKWAENRSDLLYGQKTNFIYEIFLNGEKETPIFNFNKFSRQVPKTWLINNRNIYWLTENQKNSILYQAQLNELTNQTLKILIEDTHIEFCSPQVKDLLCLKGKNFFWLIKNWPEKLEIIFQYPLVDFSFWQNNYFIGNNDYEIITAKIPNDLNNEKIKFEISLRTGQKISKAIYYPTGDWAIFLSENTLSALELNSEKKEIKPLFKERNISDFWLNQPGSIWLITQENDDLKISKLKIQ